MGETNVDHIGVEPRPDGRRARQRNGTKRAGSLHDTQAEAEEAARAQAKRMHAEFVIKGREGPIVRRDSYGGDPARRLGDCSHRSALRRRLSCSRAKSRLQDRLERRKRTLRYQGCGRSSPHASPARPVTNCVGIRRSPCPGVERA